MVQRKREQAAIWVNSSKQRGPNLRRVIVKWSLKIRHWTLRKTGSWEHHRKVKPGNSSQLWKVLKGCVHSTSNTSFVGRQTLVFTRHMTLVKLFHIWASVSSSVQWDIIWPPYIRIIVKIKWANTIKYLSPASYSKISYYYYKYCLFRQERKVTRIL